MSDSVNGAAKLPLFDPVSRYSSPTGPITASRQERQIVQSWLDLDDFLPRFASPLRSLSGRESCA